MQRFAVLSAVLFSAVPAVAHPVHVAEEAGHTHWLGLAAIGVAIAVAAFAYVRGSLARRRGAAAQTK